MRALIELAHQIAERLSANGQTITIAESSSGGLISAALLSVPRASRYFIGGGVEYTRAAKERHIGIDDGDFAQGRNMTEIHALIMARRALKSLGTTWGVGECGAAGPDPNGYGDPVGHGCVAVAGPVELVMTVQTRRSDRVANMEAFAGAALELLLTALKSKAP
jgi:nicotinamide-nucleotide amidase